MSLNALMLNSKKEWLDCRLNSLALDGNLTLPKGASSTGDSSNYEQATSPTTAVTANAYYGSIQTVGSGDGFNLAAFDAYSFTVNNNLFDATTDNIILGNPACLGTVAGGDGFPVVKLGTFGAGSFDIEIMNAHDTNALSPVSGVIIPFLIIKTQQN